MKRKSWAALAIVLLLILVMLGFLTYLQPSQFESHGLGVMKNLNQGDVKTTLRNKFERDYYFKNFVNGNMRRLSLIGQSKSGSDLKTRSRFLRWAKACAKNSAFSMWLCV